MHTDKFFSVFFCSNKSKRIIIPVSRRNGNFENNRMTPTSTSKQCQSSMFVDKVKIENIWAQG